MDALAARLGFTLRTRPPFTPASACVKEHVVLFKVKPEMPLDKVQALLDGLYGLRELDGVLHLTNRLLACYRTLPVLCEHCYLAQFNTVNASSYFQHHEGCGHTPGC
ncbi:hypothetical protein O6H91_13G050900 [Diphasiastrum complanatum]|uniref:Uncharacterized protein n=1 Tax=Diphasiastrum complanatum TaxID=34168 RepID=A0ACC2BVQ8_DIPCM|nr:hypothetical protein O6H91_13G050900 [Diphasiastrum complanatum]